MLPQTDQIAPPRDMDEPMLRARHGACLLTAAEQRGGPPAWAKLPDPFPRWSQGA